MMFWRKKQPTGMLPCGHHAAMRGSNGVCAMCGLQMIIADRDTAIRERDRFAAQLSAAKRDRDAMQDECNTVPGMLEGQFKTALQLLDQAQFDIARLSRKLAAAKKDREEMQAECNAARREAANLTKDLHEAKEQLAAVIAERDALRTAAAAEKGCGE